MRRSSALFPCLSVLVLVLGLAVQGASAQQGAYGTEPKVTAPGATVPGSATAWRLRIMEAAVVNDDVVRLGDIALPLGNMPAQEWAALSSRPLWAAPPTPGKPLQINKQRLASALRESLGDLADACILPNSLAIQRGGSVLLEDDLRTIVVRTLTPQVNLLGGRGELTDFRLPPYAFAAHDGQSVVLEPVTVAPGRIGLRFAVKEMDGSSVRKFSGSTFLNLWMDVPVLTRSVIRGEPITPDIITFLSFNLAYQKGAVWDGRGGPWQALRNMMPNEPIMAGDLVPLSAIHRGDKVTLVYRRGDVQLQVLVEALEEGSPGDTIAVRNLDSKKQVYATVVDRHTVETR